MAEETKEDKSNESKPYKPLVYFNYATKAQAHCYKPSDENHQLQVYIEKGKRSLKKHRYVLKTLGM